MLRTHTLTLSDGTEAVLVLDARARAEGEAATGVTLVELMRRPWSDQHGPQFLRAALAAGQRRSGAKAAPWTIDRVYAVIDQIGPVAALQALATAFNLAFATPGEAQTAGGAEAPPGEA